MWGNLTPTNIGTVMVAPPICYTDVVRTGFEPVHHFALRFGNMLSVIPIAPPDCNIGFICWEPYGLLP